MAKENSYLTMLEATVIMQRHISDILQAKAVEAEKSRHWLCNHLSSQVFSDQDGQLKQSLEIHEKVTEVIASLTKLENAFIHNLKAVLNNDEEESAMDMSGFGMGDLFGKDDNGDD